MHDMPILDIAGLVLIGASALATILALSFLRSGSAVRGMWAGASLSVLLFTAGPVLGRMFPDLGARSAAFALSTDRIFPVLAIFAAAFAVDHAVRQFIWLGLLRDGDRSKVPSIVIGMASAAGYAATGLFIASAMFGFDITAVAATSGVLAIVLGVSAQQTLGQVFAGLALNVSRPFRLGDSLQIDGVWGVVVNADWRAVTLRTYEGTLVTIPNILVASSRLVNLDAPNHDLRHHIPFVVESNAPPGRVRSIALEALDGLPNVLKSPSPMILFKNFDDRGVAYEAIFWHRDPNLYILRRDEVGQALWYAFDRAGLRFAIHRRLLADPVDSVRSEGSAGTNDSLLRKYLAASPLFAQVPECEMADLAARAHRRRYAAGEPIMRVGDPVSSMFLVIEGAVSVRSVAPDGNEAELYTLGAGEIVGHMSALTGAARFATVRAIGHLDVAEFDRDSLAPLIRNHPETVEAAAREIVSIEGRVRALRESARSTGLDELDNQSNLFDRAAQRIRTFFADHREPAA